MRKLQVNVGEKVFQYELKQEQGQIFIKSNGTDEVADIRRLGPNRYSLIIGGRSMEIGVDRAGTAYKIYDGSRSQDYTVEDYEIARMKKEAGIDDAAALKIVMAPMPGLIIGINCDAGDEVKKNEPILVMEAMKMENEIRAPVDGKIKSISVEKGQSVDKGQKLVEFE